MSLAVTPGLQATVDVDRKGLGLGLQQALRGQHMLHFAGADAKRQRAERAVRGRVAVAADDGHARLRQTQFRADDVDDARWWLAMPSSGMPKSRQFFSSVAICCAAI